MGYNSVVSGHPKSIRILWVDGLSTGSPSFRASQFMNGTSHDMGVSAW